MSVICGVKEMLHCGATIQPSSTVHDLGVILDTELSFGSHVNQLLSRCFHQLCRIKSSVRALPTEAAKTVVNSFVVSRIDYCNSLLAGAPHYHLDHLQAVMNNATWLIYGVGKFDRIQHLISDRLHWLPVHKRVQFKLCLLAYKAVHGLAPHYLADMCRPVSSVDARRRLRSATREDLVIPRTATNFEARSFAVAARPSGTDCHYTFVLSRQLTVLKSRWNLSSSPLTAPNWYVSRHYDFCVTGHQPLCWCAPL